MNRQLSIIAFTLFFSIIGCSTKTTAPVAVERATDSGTDEQTSDYGSNYQTASNNNSNLWDTTTQYDDPATSPSPTPSTTPSPTPTAGNGYQYPPQWNCLNGGSEYTYPQTMPASTNYDGSIPPWYQTNSNNPSSMPRACFDDSWGGFFGEDDIFNAGLNSFGAMQGCYETVMSRAPKYCSAGYDATEVFKMSKMFLVRCFRNILKQQRQLTQWARPQQESFQENDQSFYYLLQLFSEEQ